MIRVILILMGIASVIMGLGFIVAPAQTINAQIKFYRLINWKMEPISWKREIRNTRIMGAMALAAGIATFLINPQK